MQLNREFSIVKSIDVIIVPIRIYFDAISTHLRVLVSLTCTIQYAHNTSTKTLSNMWACTRPMAIKYIHFINSDRKMGEWVSPIPQKWVTRGGRGAGTKTSMTV